MNKIIHLLGVILLLIPTITQAQFTLDIVYYDNRNIEQDHYGFHLSNFFYSCECYDPVSPGSPVPRIDTCMQIAANLKPRVLRFPAGGDHKFYHLMDDDGYGIRTADIDSFLNRGWISATTALKLEDEYDLQSTEFEDIRFIDRMIDFVEFCEDENGYQPGVIFVANVMLDALESYAPGEIESENLAAIRYIKNSFNVEVVGIEIGNEHYDDEQVFPDPVTGRPSFNTYYQAALPLLDSLNNDPFLNDIPVALVAAPEPTYGEATLSFGEIKAGIYRQWNTALKDSANSTTAGSLFDAYVVHVYNRPKDMPECYMSWYEDYKSPMPVGGYDIEVDDTDLIPPFECANDELQDYTQNRLSIIMNQWAGSCDSCLGNDKPYWMTEWGMFGINGIDELTTYSGNPITDTASGDFRNTFVDAAYAFQFLLILGSYQAVLNGTRNADIDFMIKHNYISKSLGGAITTPLNYEDDEISYRKRANYWPFVLTEPIYNKDYELINATIELLDGETREPFIQCYYYDNPASITLPTALCIEGPSGTTNPVLYMYFYNPYSDEIVFNHNEINGINNETFETYSPTSDNAAFMKYVSVDELYYNGGTTKYHTDNPFYSTVTDLEQDITGISSQVFELCNDEFITLPAYSFGYVYWGITPEPYRMTGQEHKSLRTWPVPAQQEVYLQADLPDESANYHYKIVSLSGQLVAQGIFPGSGYLTVSRNHMTPGLYLFQLTTPSGEVLGQSKVVWE